MSQTAACGEFTGALLPNEGLSPFVADVNDLIENYLLICIGHIMCDIIRFLKLISADILRTPRQKEFQEIS